MYMGEGEGGGEVIELCKYHDKQHASGRQARRHAHDTHYRDGQPFMPRAPMVIPRCCRHCAPALEAIRTLGNLNRPDYQVVRQLIDASASINALTPSGKTALSKAPFHHHTLAVAHIRLPHFSRHRHGRRSVCLMHPYTQASWRGHEGVVRLLADAQVTCGHHYAKPRTFNLK